MTNFADLAQEKNAMAFQQAIETSLSEKVAAALENKKAEVAQSMFGVQEQPVSESVGHIEKGAFHKWLGKSEDEPITHADIEKGLAAGGHAAKMANFARNFGHVK